MFCYFTNETKNVAWKVTDLEIFRTYAGVEAGWRTVDQEIYAPSNTILLEKGTTFTETNAVDSSVLYMAIDEDSTVDGDWLLNSGHRYLNFGYSFLYDDEMQESKISGMTMSGGAIYVDINGSDGNGLKGEFMINATGNNTDKFGWERGIEIMLDTASRIKKSKCVYELSLSEENNLIKSLRKTYNKELKWQEKEKRS